MQVFPSNNQEVTIVTAIMTAPAYSVSDNAIQLWVCNHPDGQADSVVNLEWCTSAALMQELIEKEVVDPLLLIVVTHDSVETGRFLAPLGAKKWQVHFRRSGTNQVFAVAVWSEKDGDYSAKKLLLKKRNGEFSVDLIGKQDVVLNQLRRNLDSIRVEVDSKSYILKSEQDKLSEPDSASPPQDASQEEVQAFQLRAQIEQLERELGILEGTYVEPEPANPALIAELEAELTELSTKLSEALASWKARTESPVYQASLKPSFSTTINHHSSYVCRSANTGELDVVVPAQLFAHKPIRVVKWLGTLYSWPRPAVDQCSLRRRALFTLATIWPRALGIAVIGFLAEIVVLVGVGVLSLAGMRNIDFGILRHPISKFGNFYSDRHRKSSIWFTKIDENGRQLRAPVFWVLNPLSILVLLGIGVIIWLGSGDIAAFYVAPVAIWMLLVLTLVLSAIKSGPLESVTQKLCDWNDRREAASFQRALAETKHELVEITCGTTLPKSTGIMAALPRHRRVAYIAHNAKAKVCKPFEG